MSNRIEVFLCYADVDLVMARKIYDDLKEWGVKPWMKEKDLMPGQNQKLMINRMVLRSDYFVALFSSKSLDKAGSFHSEIKIALEKMEELPDDQTYFIPVQINQCHPAGKYEKLKHRQPANLFSSYKEGLTLILKEIAPEKGNPESIDPMQYQPNGLGERITTIRPLPLKVEQIRSEPTKVSEKDCVTYFNLMFDEEEEKWKPFERYIDSEDIIEDRFHGLVWRRKIGKKPVKYNEALVYVEDLNIDKWAGYSNWRLPTVEEFKSLLEDNEQDNKLYINPIFRIPHSKSGPFWSSDKESTYRAWVVDFYDRTFNYANVYDFGFVFCVSSI